MKRTFVLITFVTGTSYGFVLLKSIVVAYYFGVGAELDGYYLALTVPTLFAGVLGGVLQTGFFPIFARLAAGGEHESARRFRATLLAVVAGVGLLGSVGLSLASPYLSTWLAKGASDAVVDATHYSLTILAFTFAFNAFSDYLGYSLASASLFLVAAAAPAVNALVGTVFLLAWPEGRLTNLVWGTLLGVLAQIAILVVAAHGARILAGGSRSYAFRDPRIWAEVLRLGAWILPGVVFANIMVALPPMLAADLGDGAVSAYGYASRLNGMLVQVLVMASSSLLLARFSELASLHNGEELARLLSRGFAMTVGIAVLALAWVWLVGEFAIEVAFGRGNFDTVAVTQVASLWVVLTMSLLMVLWGNTLAKLFQAWARPKFMSIVAFASLLAFVAGATLLKPTLGVEGIAWAYLVSQFVSAAALTWALLRQLREHAVWRQGTRQFFAMMPATGLGVLLVAAAARVAADGWQMLIVVSLATGLFGVMLLRSDVVTAWFSRIYR